MKLPITQASLLLATSAALLAGPYAPPAGQPGSTAIAKDDPEIRYWADVVVDYRPGDALDAAWMDTSKALGPAQGDIYSVVSLGRGGEIRLSFPEGISNGPGWDFVIFENAFDDYFLELARVGASSGGGSFRMFDAVSLTTTPVSAFGQVDATNIHNLAGKYRAGYGTPFDLDDLAGDWPAYLSASQYDGANIQEILIVDVIGDGGPPDFIYDPYPTIGSAGFDLDAVGVRYPRAFDSVKPEGSEWSYTQSIGWYVGARFPWVYSQDQGWWYVTGNDREGLWIWDAALGWLWTTGRDYPSLFSVERSGWIHFEPVEGDIRYFNDLSSGEWFSSPRN